MNPRPGPWQASSSAAQREVSRGLSNDAPDAFNRLTQSRANLFAFGRGDARPIGELRPPGSRGEDLLAKLRRLDPGNCHAVEKRDQGFGAWSHFARNREAARKRSGRIIEIKSR